jgi:hypothetical protein
LITQVLLVGTFLDSNSNPQSGVVTAVLSTPIQNNNIEVSTVPVSATMDINGQIQLELYATNDTGTTPQGATYTIYVQIANLPVQIIGPTIIPDSVGIINIDSLPWTGGVLPVLAPITQQQGDERYIYPILYNNGYPTRPIDVSVAMFIGPVQPTEQSPGDLWCNTSQ